MSSLTPQFYFNYALLTIVNPYDNIRVLIYFYIASVKETVYNTIQVILSLLLVVIILLQQKGSGLSGVFGGSSNVYSTKRGVDKILHWGTVTLAVVFFGVALLRLI